MEHPGQTILASCRIRAKALLSGEYSLLMPGGVGVACSLGRETVVRLVSGPMRYRIGPRGPWTDCGSAGAGGTLGAIVRWLTWLAVLWESDRSFRDSMTAPPEGTVGLENAGRLRDAECQRNGARALARGRFFAGGLGVELDSSGWDVQPTGLSAMLAAGMARCLVSFLSPCPGDQATERLAMLAHGLAQGGGSGYDVATCSRARSVLFSSPLGPTPWLTDQAGVLNRTGASWPDCRVLDDLGVWVVVGESGERCETRRLLADVWSSARQAPELWASHAAASRRLADCLSCPEVDEADLAARVSEANATLRLLETNAGVRIFTPGLVSLIAAANEVVVTARPSGAGGGDWAVAMGTGDKSLARLLGAWEGRIVSVVRRQERVQGRE